jgi:hypothetical protein
MHAKQLCNNTKVNVLNKISSVMYSDSLRKRPLALTVLVDKLQLLLLPIRQTNSSRRSHVMRQMFRAQSGDELT